MKLERAHEYVTTVVAVAVGVVAAYYMGTLSGTGRFGTVIGILAVLGYLGLLMALREQIWLLIPFSLPFAGQIVELKGHPAIRDLAVLFVFAGVFALRAFKIIRRKPTYRAVDFWAGIVLLYLLTVYIRNPVGGEALGSARVGGRPYLDSFTAALAYWVLARAMLPAAYAGRAFVSVAALSFLASFLGAVQIWFPATSPLLNPLIGGGQDENNSDSGTPAGEDEVGRKFYLCGVGESMTQAMVAAFPPASLFNPLRFFRFVVFATGLVCLLLSGFRSAFFNLGVAFLIVTYMRGDLRKVSRLLIYGAIALTLVLLMQGTVINLPPSIQRSLSFLPGKWDAVVLTDAKFSADWRFDMWEQMIMTDRYIDSKWLGDGFGMTTMQLQQSTSTAGMANTEQQKESFMVSGIVHSGPVSAIKYVGYVGLFFFLCFQIAIAREAWVLCRLGKDSPYFALTLFFAVPAIYHPIGFVLIYGAYGYDLPRALIAAGMMKVLRTSIEGYRALAAPPKPADAPLLAVPAGGRALPAHMRF